MSLSLELHMHTLFHKGLKLVKEYEESISNEWEQMYNYFKKSGKKSAIITKKSINIFSRILFQSDHDQESLLVNLKNTWNEEIGENHLSQFIISLLESSIHRAINLKTTYTHTDYQSIQYVFNKINEYILSSKSVDPFSIDAFLQHLVNSHQLPIEWIAFITTKDETLLVNRWFSKKQKSLPTNVPMEADSIYAMIELLMEHIARSNKKMILPIPFENATLLFCTKKEQTEHVLPLITYALQLFQSGKSTLKITRQEQQWKDSVIMFNESIIRARTFNDAVDIITEGFVNYLPFERCGLFSYSSNDEIGFGLSGHRHDRDAIRDITENIKNLPLINNGLELLRLFGNGMKYLQPLYIADARDGFPKQYIDQFQLKSLVVAPIFTPSNNQLIGAAILDQGANTEFTISQETYTALIKFGQSAGEVLGKFHTSLHSLNKTLHFSPREIEVLELMAEGESTTGAADKLHLSEYTVRDYITAIMQKMEAKNRTEAVARAIRKGII